MFPRHPSRNKRFMNVFPARYGKFDAPRHVSNVGHTVSVCICRYARPFNHSKLLLMLSYILSSDKKD